MTPIVIGPGERAQPRCELHERRRAAIRRCSTPGTCGPEARDPPGRRRRAGPGAAHPRAVGGAVPSRPRRARPPPVATAVAPALARRRPAGPTPRSRRRPAHDPRVADEVGGGFPNNSSAEPSISADGRYVAFASSGSNLVGRPARHGAATRRCSCATARRARRAGCRSRRAFAGRRQRPGAVDLGRRLGRRVHLPGPGARFTSVGSIVLAWDRATGKTEVVSRDTRRAAPAAGSREPSVSANGAVRRVHVGQPGHRPAGGNDAERVPVRPAHASRRGAISVGFSGSLHPVDEQRAVDLGRRQPRRVRLRRRRRDRPDEHRQRAPRCTCATCGRGRPSR